MVLMMREEHSWHSFVDVLRWRARHQPQERIFTFLTDGEIAEEHCTYAELDVQARRIAVLLHQHGVQVGERVLLLYQPGLEYIAAIFGCFYAGAVAVPAYPPRLNHNLERIEHIIRDAGARFTLTVTTIFSGLQRKFAQDPLMQQLQWMLTDDHSTDGLEVHWQLPDIQRDTLALLQYTSGSTGNPKGVMVTHDNLLQNSQLIQEQMALTTADRCVSWLPPYHDMGLMSAILEPVYVGIYTVLLAPATFLQRPLRWLQAISRYKATISGGPNFAFELCVQKATPADIISLDLRQWDLAFTGSEPVAAATLDAFLRTFAPSGLRETTLYPCYGMAEATLFLTGGARQEVPIVRQVTQASLEQERPRLVDESEQQGIALVSCGRLHASQHIRIVDPVTQVECAPHQIGEIWVSSPNVTRGYWGKPQETQETFGAMLSDERQAQEGPFLRTGDLGFLLDGELYVTGRLKDVIIIRGRNLYPHDIEAVVGNCHPALRAGNGAAFAIPGADTERLVVVQEVARHYQQWEIEQIVQAIRAAVASAFDVDVAAIALLRAGSILKTSSGKIQHRACREGFLQQKLTEVYRWEQQQTEQGDVVVTEAEAIPSEADTNASLLPMPGQVSYEGVLSWLTRQIARQAHMHPDGIDIHQSVASFGLDSVAAIGLTNDLAVWSGHPIAPTLVYEVPTIEALAQAIVDEIVSQSPVPERSTRICSVARDGDIPLSFAQERLWFLDRLTPLSAEYTIATAIQLTGSLSIAALEQSLLAIIKRHEILRTVFREQQGEARQHILPAVRVDMPIYDISADRTIDNDVVRYIMQQEAQHPFDLTSGPLLRARLIRSGDRNHILLFTIHHIIADGWSMGVLMQELSACYHAAITGAAVELPALPIQYADFALWQRQWLQGAVLQEQLAYWRAQLADAPAVLELPTDRPRPVIRTDRGARQSLLLPARLTQDLKQLSQREDVTFFMTLLAAFQVLLMRYSGQEDIVVGTPIANRVHQDLERLIGMFVNTLVLRTDLSGNPSFRQLLARVRDVTLGAYAHQDLPFERLVEALSGERSLSYTPLFQVLFVLQNTPQEALQLDNLSWQIVDSESTSAKFDLTMELQETEQGLLTNVTYRTELFAAATITRWLAHWQALLTALVEHPEQSIASLPLLTTEEQQFLLQGNQPSLSGAYATACLHQLIEQQVERTPDAVAIVYGEQQLTYCALNQFANQLAHLLLQRGIGPEIPVGICLPPSPALMIAVLAVLKAGGMYVPLDPTHPRERSMRILDDAGAVLVLTRGLLAESLRLEAERCLCVDQQWSLFQTVADTNPQSQVQSAQAAYLLYTSGSTGTPKGVIIEQRALLNYVLASSERGQLEKGIYAMIQPFTVDSCLTMLFPALLTGGALCLFSRDDVLDAQRLACAFAQTPVDYLKIAPSHLAALLSAETETTILPRRTLIIGGEASSWEWSAQVRAQMAQGTVFNHYGPTETTVGSLMYQVEGESGAYQSGITPLGTPLAQTQTYVLDEQYQLVPIGVVGELYIGGAGLARGYLGRPDSTAERFLPDPFGQEPGARLYKTGDLVRQRADGVFEFLGRRDAQVKMRGNRIELGEIEAALRRHRGIREAVVVVQQTEQAEKQLVAYLVAQAEVVSPFDLQQFLQRTLPVHMVPMFFVWLEAFPLTPHGKLDRRALPPVAEQAQQHHSEVVALRTPQEEMIGLIWADLLHLSHSQLSIDDNFFTLGGHSLLATQVQARIRQVLHVEIAVRDLFEAPTIAGLAHRVEELQQQAQEQRLPALVPMPRAEAIPLSFAQERLWFLQQLEPESSAYHMPGALRVQGPLQVQALEQSLRSLQRRHEALRTTFVIAEGAGYPIQMIAALPAIALPVVDLCGLAAPAREEEMQRLVRQEAQQLFDLTTGPLLRVTVLCLAEQEYVLLVTMHHIVSDGWSMSVLMRELSTLYHAAIANEAVQLPALPIQYADYALWQRSWLQGDVLEAQLAYWRTQLVGAPRLLALPTDRRRPAVQTFTGAQQSILLPFALQQQLIALSQREGVTLFMTLLAAFQVLLLRYSGQEDIVVGTPIANRVHADLEGLIGFFVNTLVLRTDLSGNPSFQHLLARVRDVTLGAYAHQDLPFERLVEEVSSERSLSYTPLFQVLFVLQNTPQEALQLDGLSWLRADNEHTSAKFDLTMDMQESADGLQTTIEYNTDLFDASTIERMLAHWQTLLQDCVTVPEHALADLTMLTDAERTFLVDTLNATHQDWDSAATLPQLIEQQVARTPDAVALVFEEQQLTYGELNRRANHLAHRLYYEEQIGPDVFVGVCMERSLALVVAVLAVLKAGGAYVPLDPTYPQDRLTYMIEDAQVPLVLAQTHVRSRIAATAVKTLCLDDVEQHVVVGEDEGNLKTPLQMEHLAYLIYTSGSTGRPKGAMNTHRNITNQLQWMQHELCWITPQDRILHKTAFSFDVSVWELFLPLMTGASLVLARPEGHRDAAYLKSVLIEQAITITEFVPAMLQALLQQEGLEQATSLRLFMSGGEALTPELQENFFTHFEAQVQLYNTYGPAEAAINVTAWECQRGEEQSTVPIGYPLANTQVYILDTQLYPVPIGVAGELYIGGANIARGYQRQPDLTAERFLPNPFSIQPGARLYRTGDLTRFRADGAIEYLGRVDNQVKLRGMRIELAEIEACLQQQPGVQEAVVLLHEGAGEGVTMSPFLVAYLVPQVDVTLQLQEIETGLAMHLPDYMVPHAFVLLDMLPITANGKVDRRALLLLDDQVMLHRQEVFVAPSTPTQELLAQIWREMLQLSQVGIHDNFFALGGHSLLATGLIAHIRTAFHVDVPLRSLFETPTIAQMATLIERLQSEMLGMIGDDELEQMLSALEDLGDDELLPASEHEM